MFKILMFEKSLKSDSSNFQRQNRRDFITFTFACFVSSEGCHITL